jgi:hypothetical protein
MQLTLQNSLMKSLNDRFGMKIGDTFKTREGEFVTIYSVTGSTPGYPVIAIDSSKRFITYTATGHFLKERVENAKDLVEKL